MLLLLAAHNAVHFGRDDVEDVCESIFNGLSKLSETRYLEIFDEAYNRFISLDPKAHEELSVLDESFSSAFQVHSAVFEDLDSLFYRINTLEELNYEKISKINELEIVSEDLYAKNMKILLKNVPDYDARLENAIKLSQENEPGYSKVAKLVCEQLKHELTAINAIDTGEDILSEEEIKYNLEHEIFYIHINTSKGYYYIIYNYPEGTASFIDGKSHQVVAKDIKVSL